MILVSCWLLVWVLLCVRVGISVRCSSFVSAFVCDSGFKLVFVLVTCFSVKVHFGRIVKVFVCISSQSEEN